MDKKHFAILKYVYRHPYVSYNKITSKFSKYHNTESIVDALEHDKYISFRIASSEQLDEGFEDPYFCSKTYLLCLPLGNEEVEMKFENNFRWMVTTGIAIFAAIGAYREELACILRALKMLPK